MDPALSTQTSGDLAVAGTGVVLHLDVHAGLVEVTVRAAASGELAEATGPATAAIEALTAQHPDATLHLIADHPADRPEVPVAILAVALAARLGLAHGRRLLQLRRPLPVADDDPGRVGAPGLRLRPFRPGHDDDAWLRVNNTAFAQHPDQGTETPASLARTLAEPWVDLDGFLVCDDADRPGELAGFCWTRVHPATDDEPRLGEIFVIGVAPAHHGQRLGATLVLAGLDHLAWLGVRTGMLYVEGDNDAAQHLYRRLGFTTHLVRQIHRR